MTKTTKCVCGHRWRECVAKGGNQGHGGRDYPQFEVGVDLKPKIEEAMRRERWNLWVSVVPYVVPSLTIPINNLVGKVLVRWNTPCEPVAMRSFRRWLPPIDASTSTTKNRTSIHSDTDAALELHIAAMRSEILGGLAEGLTCSPSSRVLDVRRPLRSLRNSRQPHPDCRLPPTSWRGLAVPHSSSPLRARLSDSCKDTAFQGVSPRRIIRDILKT